MNDEADLEIVADLRAREERLEWLKRLIFDLEYAGRYGEARRSRELLALATETIGLTRMRLARATWYRTEAGRVRRQAEAMRDQLMRQKLLVIVYQHEQKAQALEWADT